MPLLKGGRKDHPFFMKQRVMVERCSNWTEILNFLLNVNVEFKNRITTYFTEVYYIEETDDYKVVIKMTV